jgi:acetyl-CoA carboxylase biotin carboxyl carrier protein
MGVTSEELEQLLKLIEKLDYNDISIEVEDLKLHVRKAGSAAPFGQGSPLGGRFGQTVPEAESNATIAPTESEAAPSSESRPSEMGDQAVTKIIAPLVGTLYRAPSPSEPPFVEVGTLVGEEDTLCLIEAMKLFNPVTAGVSGRVAEILVDDVAVVEYGQILFHIVLMETTVSDH